jgi:hypothetical protein
MIESEVTKFPRVVVSQPAMHRFGQPVSVAASSALDRPPQTERTCSLCGAVKVTVHGPGGKHWREWRRGASTAQIETDEALPCDPPA